MPLSICSTSETVQIHTNRNQSPRNRVWFHARFNWLLPERLQGVDWLSAATPARAPCSSSETRRLPACRGSCCVRPLVARVCTLNIDRRAINIHAQNKMSPVTYRRGLSLCVRNKCLIYLKNILPKLFASHTSSRSTLPKVRVPALLDISLPFMCHKKGMSHYLQTSDWYADTERRTWRECGSVQGPFCFIMYFVDIKHNITCRICLEYKWPPLKMYSASFEDLFWKSN